MSDNDEALDLDRAAFDQIIMASLRVERSDLARHLTERIERQNPRTSYGKSIKAELIRLKEWLESDREVPHI